MPATPDLQFRRLEADETELALELYQSIRGQPEPDGEAFGLEHEWPALCACEAWGLFVRGGLVGAAWLRVPEGGAAEVLTIALPRGWWKMGLTEWMLRELAKSAQLGGAPAAVVRLAVGGPAMGEILADADFSGPDPEEEAFPVGEWRCRTAGSAINN